MEGRRLVIRSAALDRTLRGVLWIALALGIAAMSLGVRQVDLGWQLPDGLAILSTHRLPTEPTVAFGLPAVPYIDEYGLYEVGLASLFQLGGFGAIHAAFAAAFLLIFVLPFVGAGRGPRDLTAAALVVCAALFVVNRFEQRPEIVGVLLLVLLLRLLRRTRTIDGGFLLRLALLLAVWTNVHSSYLIGLLALVLWLAHRALLAGSSPRIPGAACALAAVIACGAVLINPYGIGRVAFTFAQQFDVGSNLLSREMWPVWEQSHRVQAVMAASGIVLVVALRSRPPAWLAGLAGTLFILTLLNIRQMSFLAAGLLFLAADRPVVERPPSTNLARTALLTLGCIASLLFGSAALRTGWANLRAAPGASGFPPVLKIDAPVVPCAVLCYDVEGSYLTLTCPRLHPLIDSGQGRFDDATKRVYFFMTKDAAAFDDALQYLPHVGGVLVTRQVQVWAVAMAGRPGWHLVKGGADGLFFRRNSGPTDGPAVLDPATAQRLAACRDEALARADVVRAFCFSVQVDPPAQSLRLLDRSAPGAWSEPFYSFTRAWLARVGMDATPALVANPSWPTNPLLAELLRDRSLSVAPLPPAGPSNVAALARVTTLLDRHRMAEASALFRSLRKPTVSPWYFTLRGELNPDAGRHALVVESWQDWWESRADLDRALARLDAQASTAVRPPARR